MHVLIRMKVCAPNQYDFTIAKKYGYDGLSDFWAGKELLIKNNIKVISDGIKIKDIFRYK